MLAVLTLITECLILAVFNESGADEISDAAAFFVILVFSFAYICSLTMSERVKDIKAPLICGYIWRLLLLFWDIYGRSVFILPNAAGDAEGFYRSAAAIASGNLSRSNFAFTSVMGTIFSYTGISRMLGQFFVLIFSVVAMHAAGWIFNELKISKDKKKAAMYILCLLPNFAILSVVFLRESVVTMFVSLSLYCFVRWYTTKKEVYFLTAFAFVFCGAAFHSGVVGLAVGYVVVRMLYDSARNQLKISAKGIIFAVFFLFVFIYLFNNYSDKLFGKMESVESLEDVANVNDAGGSSYAAYVGNSNTPVNMAIYTVPRIVYFLFSPFPWQWRGIEDIIAFCFSSMFYLYTLYRAILYIMSGEEENRILIITLIILAVCTVFVFAWGVSNTGTAARHREKMVVLYLVLYGVTPKLKKMKRRELISE